MIEVIFVESNCKVSCVTWYKLPVLITTGRAEGFLLLLWYKKSVKLFENRTGVAIKYKSDILLLYACYLLVTKLRKKYLLAGQSAF